jgi:hypothetical protein
MLANISEIETDVRSLINEATASFWTSVEIQRWVNEGQEILANETGLLSSYYSKTLEAADIVNDREIRLYTDFLAFDEGGVLYNDEPVVPTSLKSLDEWHGTSWRDTTGTPSRYYIRGDYLGFYPKPSAGDTVKYYGIERPTELSGDTAPLSGDYRTVAFRSYIRDYAVGMAWYKKNEMGKYGDMMQRFYNGVNRIKNLLRQGKNQQGRFIPEYRPTTRYVSTDALEMR